MSKKNKDYSRRDFLKHMGAATAVGVPLLNSSVAMGATSTAPLRVVVIALQHGWGHVRNIDPIKGSEYNFTLPHHLRNFNEIKNQMVFIDGLRTSYWGNAHDVSYTDILTCSARPETPTGLGLDGHFPPPHSASIDWMIEELSGKPTLRLSHGYRSWGMQYHPMSFGKMNGQLAYLPYHTTPQKAFQSIIDPMRNTGGGGGGGVDQATIAHNQALLKSLNKDASKLLAMVSGREKQKIDRYLASLTDMGKRFNTTMPAPSVTLPPNPAANVSFEDGFDDYLELIQLCFKMDTHRAAVVGLGSGFKDWTWNDNNGVARLGNIFGSDFHHDIAHYNEEVRPSSRKAYEAWVTWYTAKVVKFVKALAATPDVDGKTLLDNTLIVLTGEVGDGGHDRANQLYTLIGGGSRIKRGRWIKHDLVSVNKPMGVQLRALAPDGSIDATRRYGNHHAVSFSVRHAADLWTRIGQLAGLNITQFGDYIHNTGPLDI